MAKTYTAVVRDAQTRSSTWAVFQASQERTAKQEHSTS